MTDTGFSRPPAERYFEDYLPGSVHVLGTIDVDEHEVLEFARRFDPQPMHVDHEAAARSVHGGVIASGWHTGSLMMRVIADTYLPGEASVGSPGVDELRWSRPVRPGDVLTVTAAIVDARRSQSRPEMGLVRTDFDVTNQHGDSVLTCKAVNFMLCRP